MDYPKFIVSNQKEESISVQRVNRLWVSENVHVFLCHGSFIIDNIKNPDSSDETITVI